MSTWEEQYKKETGDNSHYEGIAVYGAADGEYDKNFVEWLEQTADRLREENERLNMQLQYGHKRLVYHIESLENEVIELENTVALHDQWVDGRIYSPQHGIPVLGYYQHSETMQYELDIVDFEMDGSWRISTTREMVDLLCWHALPEPPKGGIK